MISPEQRLSLLILTEIKLPDGLRFDTYNDMIVFKHATDPSKYAINIIKGNLVYGIHIPVYNNKKEIIKLVQEGIDEFYNKSKDVFLGASNW